jgi:hypothetical protein
VRRKSFVRIGEPPVGRNADALTLPRDGAVPVRRG